MRPTGYACRLPDGIITKPGGFISRGVRYANPESRGMGDMRRMADTSVVGRCPVGLGRCPVDQGPCARSLWTRPYRRTARLDSVPARPFLLPPDRLPPAGPGAQRRIRLEVPDVGG